MSSELFRLSIIKEWRFLIFRGLRRSCTTSDIYRREGCWMSVILKEALRTTLRRTDGSAQGWTSTPIHIQALSPSNVISMKDSLSHLKHLMSSLRGGESSICYVRGGSLMDVIWGFRKTGKWW